MASHLKPSFKALGVSLKGKTAFFVPVNTLGEKKKIITGFSSMEEH